jgi:hypothetical protein
MLEPFVLSTAVQYVHSSGHALGDVKTVHEHPLPRSKARLVAMPSNRSGHGAPHPPDACARAAQFQEHYDRAANLHHEAVALHRARGDERRTVQPLSALAAIALQLADRQQAGASSCVSNMG